MKKLKQIIQVSLITIGIIGALCMEKAPIWFTYLMFAYMIPIVLWLFFDYISDIEINDTEYVEDINKSIQEEK